MQLLKAELELRLSRALAALRDSSEPLEQRVHETRRQLKRLRATYAIVGEENPLGTSDRFGIAAVARSLGRLRDPFAQLSVWREFSQSLEPELATEIQQLLERRQANTAAPERMQRTLQRSERVLETLQDRVSQYAASPAPTNDPLAQNAFCGIRAAYRKARHRLRRAQQKASWKRLHALRRASQWHRYQLQLLQEFVGKQLTSEVKRAARLVDQLGLHHDLGAIERYLGTVPGTTSTQARRVLRGQMRKLATSALRHARKVFSESPAAFERRIRGYVLERAPAVVSVARSGEAVEGGAEGG